MEILTKIDGLILMAIYFAVMFSLVLFQRKGTANEKSVFLVANRNIPAWMGALSIAATWIWAPSLFVSSEKAYTQGLVGVFWFVVPNIATLIIFGFFANKMRKLRPEGWTFSDYIREKYSNRTHSLFLVESFGLQTMSFAVQLLAGATIFHTLTGLPFFLVTVLFAVIPLVYTYSTGIKASIFSGYTKMIWIGIVVLIGLFFMIKNGGTANIINGLGGISGQFSNLFNKNGLAVTLSFGIPTTIGLLAGTFGDQMFWQRVFSIKANHVKKAMFMAAIFFGIVPISLSVFGFVAAGAHIEVQDTQLANVAAVINYAPVWFLWLFLTMILSGLLSTVDSIICAVSSITGHDIHVRLFNYLKPTFGKKRTANNIYQYCTWRMQEWIIDNTVKFARLSMIAVTIVAILIANIPGLKIVHLFLIYGTLRSAVTLPTVFAIKGIGMSEKGLYYGLITSICIGLPIFTVGNFTANTALIITGSLFTISMSGLLARIIDKKNRI